MIDPAELVSLANSPFAKEQADLVILGTPDGSGVDVADRLADVRYTHGMVDYRLVPATLLRRTVAALSDAAARNREVTAHLNHFMHICPRDQWPPDLRAAAELWDEVN